MTGAGIPLSFCFFMAAGFFVLSGTEPVRTDVPVPAKTRYFQDSGSQMDSLIDRIRFKISYSWMKSGEYFRLAWSSVTDSLPAKARDVESRMSIRKDELLDRGKQAVRDTADQAARELSRQGAELKQDLNKIGSEMKSEASKEIRETADQLLK